MKRIFGLLSALIIISFFCLFFRPVGAFSPALAQSDQLSIIQITEQLTTDAFVRGISDDGKRIVFESTSDLTGSNPDLNNEIFLYEVDNRTIIQITNTKNVTDPMESSKVLINISNHSPAISGDGTRIVFTSNSGTLTGTKNDDGNQEIYLAILPRGETVASFVRITDTDGVKETFDNYSPTINVDGTLVGFVSTRNVFRVEGTVVFTADNADANGEILLYNLTSGQFTQVTRSLDRDATVGVTVKGFNSNPFLSGNGRVLVFLSGFNYSGTATPNNADFNGEIYLYNVGAPSNTFTQITDTTGNSAVPVGGAVNVLSAHSRHLNNAGTLLVFESSGNFAGKNADQTREVFLYDITNKTFTQLTDQTTADAAKSDFNFSPSINAAGTFITFGSVLNLVPTNPSDPKTDNADNSREVFRYETATASFRQITFSQPSAFLLDQRENVISPYIDTAGTQLVFSAPFNPVGANADLSNEIFRIEILPVNSINDQAVTLTNAASFETASIARGSIVAAFGTQLANTTAGAAGGLDLPYDLSGVRVTVAGVAARIIFVSPLQVNFVFPQGIAAADEVNFSINNNGLLSSGKVKVVDAAPGIFTVTGDGTGPAAALCGQVSDDGMKFLISLPPCSVGTEMSPHYLILFGTGWRNASSTTVAFKGEGTEVTTIPSFAGKQPDFLGLDQINLTLPQSLAGKGTVELTVSATSGTTTTTSRPVKVTFQ